MKENREEYQVKITKEITAKLNLNMDKQYSIEEINELLERHNMRGGIIQFIPTKPHSALQIIETLVTMDMSIEDAIDNVLGSYEDKSRCLYCNEKFVEDRMFQFSSIKDSPFLCEDCRRKNKLKISFWDFARRISEEERELFIKEEFEYGIDYSDYIEKLKSKK